ncbi:hypothetical protein DFJ74DRAFT_531598 [Hyaloraphidium curvatum]|nr:hypothetical protein DFJ74DRAFT_531598 [Hyaloraphidium curvatum]
MDGPDAVVGAPAAGALSAGVLANNADLGAAAAARAGGLPADVLARNPKLETTPTATLAGDRKPYYPFFDIDVHTTRYRLGKLDPTARRERHGLSDIDYEGPAMFYADPGSAAVFEDGGRADIKLNIMKTFRHMLRRTIDRLSNGEYLEGTTTSKLWKLCFAAIAITFIAALIWRLVSINQTGNTQGLSSIEITIEQYLLYFVVIVVIPYVFVSNSKASELTKAVFLTIDFWALAIFLLNIVFTAEGVDRGSARDNPRYRAWFITLTVAAVVVVVVLITLVVVRYHITPYLLRVGWLTDEMVAWIFQIKENPDQPWTYSFRPFAEYWGQRNTISYRGDVNDEGRPDGLGEWVDDSQRGESLIGYFQDGIPTAPFTSTEPFTGSAFTALRIGVIRNNAAAWDDGNLKPARDPRGLTLAVAAAEVSIAGKFLKSLPIVSLLMEPEVAGPSSTAKMMELLAGPPCEPSKEECVLYIHGLWNTAETAISEISQFRALSAYDPSIKWFIFDWPAGLYPWATFFEVRRMSKSEGVKADLRDCIKLLTGIGFKTFHIIGHSMGCRMSCHITEFIEDLFAPLPESPVPQPAKPLPTLASLTLIHGELDLVDFISIKFPVLKQYTRLITSYTDTADQALGLAETLTGRLMMGRNPAAYFVDPAWENPGASSSFDLVRQARGEFSDLLTSAPVWLAVKRQAHNLKTVPTSELAAVAGAKPALAAGQWEATAVDIPLGDLKQAGAGAAAGGAEPEFDKNTKFRGPMKIKEPRVKAWLDMDVIDSSFLDSNASAVRHSIFVFNRSLLDDIHSIISERRRAKDRTKLLRRSGNNYYFVVAPSFMSI